MPLRKVLPYVWDKTIVTTKVNSEKEKVVPPGFLSFVPPVFL
jgi:hypothetical protein